MPEPEIIEGHSCRSQIGRVCRESGFDAVLKHLSADMLLQKFFIVPEDFKELSIAVAKDSVNYSAPMTFPRSQIISILSEIHKHN